MPCLTSIRNKNLPIGKQYFNLIVDGMSFDVMSHETIRLLKLYIPAPRFAFFQTASQPTRKSL
jgi:hypothetical protein